MAQSASNRSGAGFRNEEFARSGREASVPALSPFPKGNGETADAVPLSQPFSHRTPERHRAKVRFQLPPN